MAESTVPCPHCKVSITVPVGKLIHCPECGGEVRVHAVGTGEEEEALKRLLSSVKIVERVGDSPAPRKPRTAPKPPPSPKRPWWKFWG